MTKTFSRLATLLDATDTDSETLQATVDGNDIAVSLEFITPEYALELLETNTHNRRVRDTRVEQFAEDIASGTWLFNGDSIRINADGVLVDGQHRLHAVLTAEHGIWTVIIRGLSADAQDTMDDGAKRSFADVLTLNGATVNTGVLAAVIRKIITWERHGKPSAGRTDPTKQEMLTYWHHHRDTLDYSVRKTLSWFPATEKNVAASIAATCHLAFARIDAVHADDFMYRVGTGTLLEFQTGAWLLHNLMVKTVQLQGSRDVDVNRVAALFTKAWNLERCDGRASKLVYNKNVEKYPQPR